ncbi:hypothetical protein J5A56_03110 [Prevotella melaninogenica]|jgi:hypothetical protein|uniref:hypothetical protein n=1 Tax=Prevotella TaxID=838 RepID=UPI0003AD2A5D|nr:MULTISPECIES: hypothetical protein [Prevotella]ERJ78852.1 hypothetical protein HMPREF9148_00711 [Prevotella sp. F0091]QUB72335.1 hypothetical protein J5A56_03110 [Prevotella melaninogenica]
MNNNDYFKTDLRTSVVFHESKKNHGLTHVDGLQKVVRTLVLTALMSSVGVAGANSICYVDERSTSSVSLSSFNENFIVKSSFSSVTPIEDTFVNVVDDEEYDDVEAILYFAHSEGMARDAKMKIISRDKGYISLTDELFEDFDYE